MCIFYKVSSRTYFAANEHILLSCSDNVSNYVWKALRGTSFFENTTSGTLKGNIMDEVYHGMKNPVGTSKIIISKNCF